MSDSYIMLVFATRSTQLDWRTVSRGVWGLFKAIARFEPADDATRQVRRASCAKCPEAKHVKRVGSLNVLTATSSCGVCRCNLRAKTRVGDEACPLGKW
ncbi:MAG: hypothetical protein AAF916_10175 [Planctomycetota bacterium]